MPHHYHSISDKDIASILGASKSDNVAVASSTATGFPSAGIANIFNPPSPNPSTSVRNSARSAYWDDSLVADSEKTYDSQKKTLERLPNSYLSRLLGRSSPDPRAVQLTWGLADMYAAAGSGAVVDTLSLGPLGTKVRGLTARHVGSPDNYDIPLMDRDDLDKELYAMGKYPVNFGLHGYEADGFFDHHPSSSDEYISEDNLSKDWQSFDFVIPRGDPAINNIRPAGIADVDSLDALNNIQAEVVGYPVNYLWDRFSTSVDNPYHTNVPQREMTGNFKMLGHELWSNINMGPAASGSGYFDMNTGKIIGIHTAGHELQGDDNNLARKLAIREILNDMNPKWDNISPLGDDNYISYGPDIRSIYRYMDYPDFWPE